VSLSASRGLRREIHDGLNVVENWNSANGFIFYGKGGEISTNQRDEPELAVLSLHLSQSSLVYINTLMLQCVLTAPAWMAGMTTDDLRRLTPLIYTYVNPYLDISGAWGSCDRRSRSWWIRGFAGGRRATHIRWPYVVPLRPGSALERHGRAQMQMVSGHPQAPLLPAGVRDRVTRGVRRSRLARCCSSRGGVLRVQCGHALERTCVS
jgi:hypothetical protein